MIAAAKEVINAMAGGDTEFNHPDKSLSTSNHQLVIKDQVMPSVKRTSAPPGLGHGSDR